MNIPSWNSASDKASEGAEPQAGTSPLLEKWQSEMEQRVSRATEIAATQAAEKIREAAEQFQREQHDAHSAFSEEIASKQQWLAELRSEFERSARQSRELSEELERAAAALRAEKEAAIESAGRMAQARLGMEAAEASLEQQRVPEPPKDGPILAASDNANLREHLDSEVARAKSQWDELLQSSLDSSIERLVGEISRHSQEVLRAAEQRMSERVAELRQPFGVMQSEAREAVSELRPALDQELGRVRTAVDRDRTGRKPREGILGRARLDNSRDSRRASPALGKHSSVADGRVESAGRKPGGRRSTAARFDARRVGQSFGRARDAGGGNQTCATVGARF